MAGRRIVLTGMGPKLDGLRWEAENLLRIGRQANQDVVLRDFSVERTQAEARFTGARWILRDVANNEMFPTLVNNVPLRNSDQELKSQDVLQFGKITLKVTTLETEEPDLPVPASGVFALPGADNGANPNEIRTSTATLRVQAATHNSWDQALQMMADGYQQRPRQGQAMLTLLRANHHLAHLGNIDELSQSILVDAISTLGAQRGSVILADAVTGQLELKAVQGPGLAPASKKFYSRTLAERCFRQGESLLCRDVNADDELMLARSVRHGAMSSVICALLRSPRNRLGILQLDRGPFQEPFSENDLYLADAIAASVAIGIECAQLVEQQREQFIQAVTSLARSVEMRDQCTGDHTRRVTDYALLLADELKLSTTKRYEIQVGTPLHDIGKIGIDDAILRKPGKLTVGEFEVMKTHTTKGAAILESILNLSPMIPIVRNHHERWDGSGYPDGLAREDIAQTARIVAVVDAFDAMTSNRPYRLALPMDQAYFELVSKAGIHFDPACVQAFIRLRPKIEDLLQQK